MTHTYLRQLGFASKGEAEAKAIILRKLIRCNTRVVPRKNGLWGIRTSFDPTLVKD